MEQNDKPIVALALILNKDGQVLAVSRKNDHFDFGFPGGKAEGDETPMETLRREIREETGLHVNPTPADFLTKMVDENGYQCYLFVCDYYSETNYFDPHLEPTGKGETGIVKWMDWSDFLLRSKSHPTYNENAYKLYLSKINQPAIEVGKHYIHKRTGELYYIEHKTEEGWLMVKSSFTTRPITIPVQFLEGRVKQAPRIMYNYSAFRTADMEVNPSKYPLDERAMVYAIGNHNAVLQEYDDHMYSKHLWDVLDVFDRFSHLVPQHRHRLVRAGLWNHDIIEDARKTWNDLKKRFDEMVADGAYAMSNDKGRNRKQRAGKKYYEGLLEYEYGEFMKLCDRIANVINGLKNGKMIDGYRQEQPDFKNKLKSGDKYQQMWDYLDNLLEGKVQPTEYHEQYN